MKYHIKPKRDFGRYGFHLINGEKVSKGFVVTDGGIVNVMPGATWFRSIPDALRAIQVLEDVKGDGKLFWEVLAARKAKAA